MLPPAAAQAGKHKTVSEALSARGQVRAITQDGAGKTYIALKILPRAKIPFSTLTFRVRDLMLVNGFAAGDEVFFNAAEVEGENTLQSLRKATPCIKFQPCQLHDWPHLLTGEQLPWSPEEPLPAAIPRLQDSFAKHEPATRTSPAKTPFFDIHDKAAP